MIPRWGMQSRPEQSGGNPKSVFQSPVRSLVPDARQTTHISRCRLIALKLTRRISLRRASLGRAVRSFRHAFELLWL
jgi:hypothetical protein